MIQRDASFYDVIAYGLPNGDYQAFVDNFLVSKYNILNVDGFPWDPIIQLDFTYEQLLAELNIATLPTYVDVDSPAPYKMQDEFRIGTNKIPRFKHGFAINEKLIREKMIMAQQFGKASITPTLALEMRDLLFDSTEKLIRGNHNALTYQRMQVVSTGQYSITADNNPEGIIGLTFDFGIPAANKETLTTTSRWWTTTAHITTNEGPNSDPIKDLQDWKKAATKRGIPVGHFEMSLDLWDDMLTHTAVLKRIGALMYPMATMDTTSQTAIQVARNASDDLLKNNIERLVGCPIIVRDTMAAVEKINKTTKVKERYTLPGFDLKNVSYVPNGQIGTIKAVVPLVVPDPGARFAYYDGNRTVLTQTFNSQTKTQYIESECTALVVPSAANFMCIYTVTA